MAIGRRTSNKKLLLLPVLLANNLLVILGIVEEPEEGFIILDMDAPTEWKPVPWMEPRTK